MAVVVPKNMRVFLNEDECSALRVEAAKVNVPMQVWVSKIVRAELAKKS
jgi:hypothetical protein